MVSVAVLYLYTAFPETKKFISFHSVLVIYKQNKYFEKEKPRKVLLHRHNLTYNFFPERKSPYAIWHRKCRSSIWTTT